MFDTPIVSSTALANGVVGIVEVGALVSGFGSVAKFETSRMGAVHMEDAPADIVSGGVVAVPVKSLWQADLIGLKTSLDCSWGLRMPGAAAWIQGATW